MTNEEVLQKAIEKALHNNWEQMLPFVPTWALEQANEDRLTQHIIKTYGKSIIFSHDFAKAFWGEKRYEHIGCGGVIDVLKEIKCPKCGYVEPP